MLFAWNLTNVFALKLSAQTTAFVKTLPSVNLAKFAPYDLFEIAAQISDVPTPVTFVKTLWRNSVKWQTSNGRGLLDMKLDCLGISPVKTCLAFGAGGAEPFQSLWDWQNFYLFCLLRLFSTSTFLLNSLLESGNLFPHLRTCSFICLYNHFYSLWHQNPCICVLFGSLNQSPTLLERVPSLLNNEPRVNSVSC